MPDVVLFCKVTLQLDDSPAAKNLGEQLILAGDGLSGSADSSAQTVNSQVVSPQQKAAASAGGNKL